jgi:hypothetical protein
MTYLGYEHQNPRCAAWRPITVAIDPPTPLETTGPALSTTPYDTDATRLDHQTSTCR